MSQTEGRNMTVFMTKKAMVVTLTTVLDTPKPFAARDEMGTKTVLNMLIDTFPKTYIVTSFH